MTAPFHLIALRFVVLRPINRLPHFHGPHWSALFRNVCNPLVVENGCSAPTVWVQPIETGILSYDVDATITLGLVVKADSAATLSTLELALSRFNETLVGRGHFQPGVTVRLESVISRDTGLPWSAENPPLSMARLESEIDHLSNLESFTIETISPLRIPRPVGTKKDEHRYCDADFFLSGDHDTACLRLLEKVRDDSIFSSVQTPLAVTGGALTWLDVSYGDPKGKTVGGVAGVLGISGRPDGEQARRLVLGQYLGVGKNAAFGLGFYHIPELDSVRKIAPLTRSTTLFARATGIGALNDALDRLADSSPGPDGMRLVDGKSSGLPFLEMLRASVLTGPSTGNISMKQYQIPKSSGGKRSIYVQNLGDRVLHRAFTEAMMPTIDSILSSSAYAYRRGLSHKNAASALNRLLGEGFSHGVKADISAFFDSVNTADLSRLLCGLFPAEPLIQHINAWLHAARSQGIAGLPQGWPLSPVLSNLYLDRFDRAMEQEGFRLVRFADDFVVLFRADLSAGEGIAVVEASLARLGLALKPEKTKVVVRGEAISFLGFVVSADDIHHTERPDDPAEEDWLPVFRPDWQHGMPVYLTSVCRGAYSSGPHLVVKHDDESSDTIPWNRISRLVVVGRSPFSGGVVYRAVREQIMVTFIDIMGRTNGHLTPSGHDSLSLFGEQSVKCADAEWSLAMARTLISAKIHNSLVLLRRNEIAAPELKSLEKESLVAESSECLRGFEGAAARIFFGHLAQMVAPFEFRGRSYHPPDGAVNVMLSFGYTLLYNRLAAVLHDKGLNPRQGIFHVGRGRHCALASDLLEPLRHLADRIVLSLIHLKEISPDNFSMQQVNGLACCRMDGEGFRTFISRYEHTMASRFTPQHGEKMSYNAWLDETVDALVRSIRYSIPYQPLRID